MLPSNATILATEDIQIYTYISPIAPETEGQTQLDWIIGISLHAGGVGFIVQSSPQGIHYNESRLLRGM